MPTKVLAAAATMLAFAWVPAAHAAEIYVICSNALKSALEELTPQFEKASGHTLKVTYGTTGPLQAQIEKGAAFDLAILGPAAIDELIKQGKLLAATRADVARSGIGVAVRKGTPKPELSSTDAFKRAVVNAKSIAFNEAGLTGAHLKNVFQRLGVADEVKAKHRNGRGAELVAAGEADIGMTQVSEILPVAGAELAGPLPAEIQHYSVFPAAIRTGSARVDAGNALIKFLASPDAVRLLKAHGLEPASR
jgi:molybdate transport system substrate-binding protein